MSGSIETSIDYDVTILSAFHELFASSDNNACPAFTTMNMFIQKLNFISISSEQLKMKTISGIRLIVE